MVRGSSVWRCLVGLVALPYIVPSCAMGQVASRLTAVSPAVSSGNARAYRISDSLRRQEVGEITVSPDGKLIAICLARPVAPGERYTPEALSMGLAFFSMRNDILVVSADTGEVVWRSAEGPGTTAVYPRWSPGGDSLAYIERAAAGEVALKFWSRTQRRVFASVPIAVDFAVPMRSDGAPSAAAAPFAWVNDEQVLVVGTGAPGVTSYPFGRSRAASLESRWRRTGKGVPSYQLARADARPLCRESDQLLEVSLGKQPLLRVISNGSVKGVSVSQDGSIALVLADRRGALPKVGPLEFAPKRNYFDFDQFALWKVVIVPSRDSVRSWTVVEAGEGPISGSTLPMWSVDSKRLAGTLRTIQPDGHAENAAYEWRWGASRAHRVGANSQQESLSKAFNFVAEGACDEDSEAFVHDAAIGASSELQLTGHVDEDQRAAEDGYGRVCLRDRGARVRLPTGGKVIGVFGMGQQEELVFETANGETHGLPVGDPPRGMTSAKSRGRVRAVGVDDRGELVSASDERGGSYVCRSSRRIRRRCLLSVNTYLSAVLRPRRISVAYTANNASRRGVLLYPTRRDGAGPPPVVVVAYPQLAALDRTGGIGVAINTIAAQYTAPLTADGYAVFVVDFRLPSPLPSPAYAKENVLSEVKPAITALQKVASVDGRRLGFWGFSYGGYTALTLLAYTKSFRAIVAMEPLGDLSEYAYAEWPEAQFTPCWADVTLTAEREVEGRGGGEDGYAFIRMGAPQYRVPRKYYDNSPSLHMGGAATPALLGAADLDVFANGAEPTYLALARQGIPAEFVKFYGEGHILASPGNIKVECALTLAWLDRYVKREHNENRIKDICGIVVPGS